MPQLHTISLETRLPRLHACQRLSGHCAGLASLTWERERGQTASKGLQELPNHIPREIKSPSWTNSPCLHFYYNKDLPKHSNRSCAKGKSSNILQIMGPAPQVFQAEVQVPCQMLYQQVGATQSCCPYHEEPSINHLQVQRETPASSEVIKVITAGNIPAPELPPRAEQCWGAGCSQGSWHGEDGHHPWPTFVCHFQRRRASW